MLRDIERMLQQVEELKRSFARAIENLPDNPRITRLDGKPNVFTISSKNLGLIFSPFYHDFKSQYEKLTEIVKTARLETVGSVLSRIAETGRYFENGGTLTCTRRRSNRSRCLCRNQIPRWGWEDKDDNWRQQYINCR